VQQVQQTKMLQLTKDIATTMQQTFLIKNKKIIHIVVLLQLLQ
jgi:hypothetical protein